MVCNKSCKLFYIWSSGKRNWVFIDMKRTRQRGKDDKTGNIIKHCNSWHADEQTGGRKVGSTSSHRNQQQLVESALLWCQHREIPKKKVTLMEMHKYHKLQITAEGWDQKYHRDRYWDFFRQTGYLVKVKEKGFANENFLSGFFSIGKFFLF